MREKLTVIVADDHVLVRRMLTNWLQSAGDIDVVASVGTADDAVDQAATLRPKMILLDIEMPGLQVFEAARQIQLLEPETRVVFLSGFLKDCYIEQALAVKASGYILKTESPEVVLRALRLIAEGGTYFSPPVWDRMRGDPANARAMATGRTRLAAITVREREVLSYLARGLSKKQIAQLLHLSERTINAHCSHLMDKLNIHDRVELARFAIREGLVEP